MSFRNLILPFIFSLSLSCVLLFNACTDEKKPEKTQLFKLLSPSETGIDFTNTITESDSLNILRQANLYNGGGVGIGDFNNDGLVDIYFPGNMVSNKLYLNQSNTAGSLKFKDITEAAGVGGEGRWCTGVSVVDINADGWLDMYVSASFLEDKNRRKNLMYMNQGLNEDGIPVFKETAEAFGIADTGFSTQGVFFDYDKDGDLDLYVLTNELNDPKTPIQYRPKIADGSARNNDRLYRNEGNGTNGYPVFKDVSREAGILVEGWGHAVSISDFNLDGWPDMYVSNDFVSNDLLYINNQDGPDGKVTFTNRAADYMKHTAWNAMGTDVVDINNDGFVDIMSLEMLPEQNLRKKTMLGGNEYFNYFNNRKYDYEHQYVRNVLQLNSGMTPTGHPIFSEVAFMAGVYQTDWSWAPLIADFDNDGFRDMIITNGLPRDVTDLDYIVYDNGQDNYGGSVNATLKMVEEYFPVVKISNYGFRNNGGYTFSDSTSAWGLNLPSFSNGGVYADLDNDGDLDLVVNNINDPAFVYENTLNKGEQKQEHFLSVILKGDGMNPGGFGAKLSIYYAEDKQQVYEHQPARGYLSTVDARAHFGVGKATQVDSLRIHWPDGKSQLLTQIKADQRITLDHEQAQENSGISPNTVEMPLFLASADAKSSGLMTSSERYGIQFMHQERDAIDYNIQRTLPHKMSQYGPGIAVGDVDNNGYEDFYVGGAAGHTGIFFMQDARGDFVLDSTRISAKEDAQAEDMGALLFDADNDGDLDLYVVSGSYEFPPEHPVNQDRLYINNGRGRFQKSTTALPKLQANGSCVKAADFDQDGDLDLFVGGRSVSGSYPVAPKSYLLENQNGMFVDVTLQYCPQLQELGMITDALWSDFDQDGLVDLVITGEWMPITFLKNTGNLFENVNEKSGIAQHLGWWNSLTSGDFDKDGDIDYIAGNLGLNSNYHATAEEPMTLLAKDVDDNGKIDPMVFCYMMAEDSTQKPFPMHTRDDMISQLVSIRKQYPTYESYGRATMGALWNEKNREGAIMLKANDLHSSYIENLGDGKFSIKPLPLEAQLAPLYGMLSEDVNGDGNPDLLLVGNDYGIEPISGRHDAFNGLTLIGDGKGNFNPLTIAESGFFVPGDAKALACVHSAQGKDLMIASQNQDSLLVFAPNNSQEKNQEWIALQPNDLFAEVEYEDNRKERLEFYHGNTFLSQSSRKIKVDQKVVSISITDFSGNKREVRQNN